MKDRLSCAEAADLLVPFLDGELAVLEAHAIEEHLACCDDCRRSLEEHRQVMALLGELPEARPGSVLVPVLAARRRGVFRQRSIRLAAAAAIAIGVGLFGYHFAGEKPPEELFENLTVVEEYASLAEADAEDLFNDPDVLQAVLELSEEASAEEY